MSLAGSIAVVTGASRGIGAAIAERLAGAGARLVRVSRSLLPARDQHRMDVPCDVTDPAQVQRLAESVLVSFGPPGLVVNSAGSFLLKPLAETSPEDFDAQLASNLRAPFLLARAFLPGMRQRGRGRLITLGSISDHHAFPENAAYGASKFGVRGMHEVLREELRGSGVLCTLVSPGPTDTEAWDPVNPDQRPGFVPRAKMLRPEDVADAVLWVASRPAHVEVDWLRLGPA